MYRTASQSIRARWFVFILVAIFALGSVHPVSGRTSSYAGSIPPGSLDITLNSNGLVHTRVGEYGAEGWGVAIQPDGKILVAGWANMRREEGANRDFTLLRYRSDGQLDPSFGVDGKVTTDFGNHFDYARAIALQPDGKILVAGYSDYDGMESEFALARYQPNGSLDTSFDQDGKVITDLGVGYDFLAAVAIQPDGKIIVTGSKNIGINNDEIVVVRYNTNGSLDTTFDSDGIIITSLGMGSDVGVSILAQPDGKILVGGMTFNGSNTDFALLRYHSNGLLDNTFNIDGIATLDFGILYGFERGGHIALQPNGKIIIAGSADDESVLLARFNPNGTLDYAFDTDGRVVTNSSAGIEGVQAVTLQKDGKIILAGYTRFYQSHRSYDFALQRYSSNGSLDTTFDTDGNVVTDFGGDTDDLANAVTVQPDGKIVLVGYTFAGGDSEIAVARYATEEKILTVTKIADTDDGVCNSDCSLREAITAAEGWETIRFASALAGQTISLTSTLAIDTPVKIDGSGLASRVSISGNDQVRVMSIPSGILVEIDSLILKDGKSDAGAGISNMGSLAVKNSLFSGHQATAGGAIYHAGGGDLTVIHSKFQGNSGSGGGAITCTWGSMSVTDSTFASNTASSDGGAIYASCDSAFSITNSTFTSNSAGGKGGAIFIDNDLGPVEIVNSTFYGNTAQESAGGIANYGKLIITNSTFSHNTSANGGAIRNGLGGVLSLRNSILANSIGTVDCLKSDSLPEVENIHTLIETTATGLESCGVSLLTSDPLLGPLQNNGGTTQTLALEIGSPAMNAGNDAFCPSTDQRGEARPKGSHCDLGAYEAEGNMYIRIGGQFHDSYLMGPGESTRTSYRGMNNGPVQILTTDVYPIITAERLIYRANGVPTSFSEMMGLPGRQLDTAYWLPWYNNVDLDTQLRFANVSNAAATIHISIGGKEMTGSPFNLAAGESTRKSFAGVNDGPVKIVSDVKIVAAERVIYKTAGGVSASFTEMMAFPDHQLESNYWLPWYNNVDLDTQLRFANVSDVEANVYVSIGGSPVSGSPFTLAPGTSLRKSFPGVNNGPVRIQSSVPIVAAERVIYKVNSIPVSFSEMMAVPDAHVDSSYWLPWYNNKDMDTQLRFANVSHLEALVHVFVGGTEVAESPFALSPGASARASFLGINNGPVHIQSNVPIVVSERVIYKVNNIPTSFSEMMALPASQLDTIYWLPWYNNLDLDTQLRFGVP